MNLASTDGLRVRGAKNRITPLSWRSRDCEKPRRRSATCGQDLTNVTGRSWQRSPAHSALGPYARSLLHRVRRRRNPRSGPGSNKCTPHPFTTEADLARYLGVGIRCSRSGLEPNKCTPHPGRVLLGEADDKPTNLGLLGRTALPFAGTSNPGPRARGASGARSRDELTMRASAASVALRSRRRGSPGRAV